MRKVEKKMIEAIEAAEGGTGSCVCGSNTVVIWRSEVRSILGFGVHTVEITVELHGNEILRIARIGDKITRVSIDLCGYNTRTTRSRLNAFFLHVQRKSPERYHLPLGVSVKKGVPFLTDYARHIEITDEGRWEVLL